jgi:lipopolysaccharide biosynthesis glycosyltransferase
MLASPTNCELPQETDPVVVLAADDQFAMPLATTIRSALDNLPAGQNLRVFVLDGGIANAMKQRVERSLPDGRHELSWVAVDSKVIARAPVSGHASRVNYYRILTPWLLPTHIGRAIYLDADVIVKHNLTQLWRCEMNGKLALAVQDCAAPYIDAATALPNYDRCGRHLGATTPIANYRGLELDPKAAYFNSGVLVMDLAAWRSADLPQKLLKCLDENRQHVRWWDQYALNVVLAGRWQAIDPRWNQGSHIFVYPTFSQSPFDQASYTQLRDDPYIIHFTTRYKPWLASCLHPLRKEFFHYLDRTDWAGWRPWKTTRLTTFFEIAKAQQRRVRLSRKRWSSRAAEWLWQTSDRRAG